MISNYNYRARDIAFLALISVAVLSYHLFCAIYISRQTLFSSFVLLPHSPSPSEQECRVPKLIPFEPAILDLVSIFPEPLKCHEHVLFPFYFNSSVDPYPHLIPVKSPEEWEKLGITSCFYQRIGRGNDPLIDYLYTKEWSAYPVSLNEITRIPEGHDFIAIACVKEKLIGPTKLNNRTQIVRLSTATLDMHAFAHEKPEQEKNDTHKDNNKKFNVIILGIDAVSRMAFIRSMPESYKYLMSDLGAVEMTAYHKIGDNTFPNIGPMLTNLPPIDESVLPCEVDRTYDNCPFIWKQFSQAGYSTLFAEDEKTLAIFNLDKLGFIYPPTDYYFRPYLAAANDLIGHQREQWTYSCFGPRPAFQVALDYLKKMTHVIRHGRGKKNYFQFMWSSSVTHDVLNGARVVDEYLRNGLEWWKDGGYLNDTVLIVMSDHGFRWGEMHNYYEGQLEDRLPFMYFVVPEEFKKLYPQLAKNLVENRNRLVTSVDLHATLVHILKLGSPSYSWKPYPGELTTGISLFNQIPRNRDCSEAGIVDVYCVCNHQINTLPVSNSWVQQGANFAVYFLNRQIVMKFQKCALLSLSNVFQAGKVSFGASRNVKENVTWEALQLTFQTSPGNATFEGLVLWDPIKKEWNVSGQIGRTNLYGNQSHCISDKRARLYCYCLDILDLPIFPNDTSVSNSVKS